MESNVDVAIRRTNWKLLAKQKQALIHVLHVAEQDNFTTIEEDNALTGILNWIDEIQDAAEKDGYPVVFLGE